MFNEPSIKNGCKLPHRSDTKQKYLIASVEVLLVPRSLRQDDYGSPEAFMEHLYGDRKISAQDHNANCYQANHRVKF